MGAEDVVRKLLSQVTLTVNGGERHDPQVSDSRFFETALSGSLGLGEAYMAGQWECEALDEFFFRLLRFRDQVKLPVNWQMVGPVMRSLFFNVQNRRGSRKVAEQHYNLGNDLYESFLDPYMQYTCGFFVDSPDLTAAQEYKLGLICEKLKLTSSDTVLDVGCGWGGFARFAAEKYGCHVTGISISDEQIAYARKLCAGLPVEIKKLDYRDLGGAYDKVLVCGMIEHVGWRNYRRLFEVVRKCLNRRGLFLLHTIGRNTSGFATDPWIGKYIFPNSQLPSLRQVAKASEKLFVQEHWENFSAHYDPTLMAWPDNFVRHWARIKDR